MALHRTGSDSLMVIETGKLVLTLKGKSFHPAFAGVSVTEKEASFRVKCDDDFEIYLGTEGELKESQQYGNYRIERYQTSPLFFEQQQYELVIEALINEEISFWHDNYNIRKNITPIGKEKKLLTGIVNFNNDIGYSDLVVRVNGKDYLSVTIEIFPAKISYKDDYKAILADVTDEVYSLVFDVLKKTYEQYDVADTRQSSLVEFFAIIRKIYQEFITAADIILNNPHHQLQQEHEILPWYKVKRTDQATLKWVRKHPEKVVQGKDGYLAQQAMAVRKYVTYDTKENRLTKYMLMRTVAKLERFKQLYYKLDREKDKELIAEIDRMVKEISRRSNTGFIRSVNAQAEDSGMSLVFSMAPGYRKLYRCYLFLQHGLSVTGSVFDISMKDMSVLYEYWCFIKLNRLMKDKYELKSPDILKIQDGGLYLSLQKGQNTEVRYYDAGHDEYITLSYNSTEKNSPTVAQKPDNILKLEKKGADTDYEYIFDAKYRINPALDGSDYKRNYRTPGPEVDDINTMHRYRDAVVYQKGASPYERTMFGAYVLFPYRNEEEYRDHQFYQSIDKVNIGGLPFLPSATGMVTELLDELITESPDLAFSRTLLPKGIESRLAKVDWSCRDVLIGALRNKEQLDINLKHRFYHVPKSRIPEDKLPIHYVCIYQSKNHFGKDAGIVYYGEVTETLVVKRKEISEIPKKSGELYYRFEIREWKKLDRPILPKEKGQVVGFTNMFLLTHSTYVPELYLRSQDEYRFYTELQRWTKAEVTNAEDNPDYTENGFVFGDFRISFDNGNILLLRGKDEIEKSTVDEFIRKPNMVFRKLMKKVSEEEAAV